MQKEESLRDHAVYHIVPALLFLAVARYFVAVLSVVRKRDEAGNVTRHKVHFVAKDYKQIYGQDFTQTTAPTARLESFRVLLHLAAARDWECPTFRCKTAFLNGVLPDDEIQYMEQPEGFAEGPPDSVWELHKGLYGMRQSGRIWNKQMYEAMLTWGSLACCVNGCVYYRHTSDGIVMQQSTSTTSSLSLALLAKMSASRHSYAPNGPSPSSATLSLHSV